MSRSPKILWMILVLFFLQGASCGGKLELRFIQYENPGSRLIDGHCCDNVKICLSDCETFFKVCMDRVSRESSCALIDFETPVLGDDKFKFGSFLGSGRSNPFVYSFHEWVEPFKIRVTVLDDDGKNALGIGRKSDLISNNEFKVSKQPYVNLPSAVEQSVILRGYRSKLTLSYKIYCDDSYFSPSCSQKCVLTNDTTGHYTCDYTSGKKICMKNWYGESCTSFCRPNNDATNGFYTCSSSGIKICMSGWHGKDCKTHCIPRNDTSGHYICDADGNKICLTNWSGHNCSLYTINTTKKELGNASVKSYLVQPSTQLRNNKQPSTNAPRGKTSQVTISHFQMMNTTSGTVAAAAQSTLFNVNMNTGKSDSSHVVPHPRTKAITESRLYSSKRDHNSKSFHLKMFGSSSFSKIDKLTKGSAHMDGRPFITTSSRQQTYKSRHNMEKPTREGDDKLGGRVKSRLLVIIGAVFLISLVLMLALAGCRKIYQRKTEKISKVKNIRWKSKFTRTELAALLETTEITSAVTNNEAQNGNDPFKKQRL